MCIVSDVNALPFVFTNKVTDFTPVKDWLIKGPGKIVYGGTSYIYELTKMARYNRILKLLGDQNKTVVVEKTAVDHKQREIVLKLDNKCNDPHLIAILAVSRCKLICSKDVQSYRFLKQSDLYPHGYTHPKIYSKRQHANLLCDANIADCCLPRFKLNKRQMARLNQGIGESIY